MLEKMPASKKPSNHGGQDASEKKSARRNFLYVIQQLFLWTPPCLILTWAFGICYFDGPFSSASVGNFLLGLLWLGSTCYAWYKVKSLKPKCLILTLFLAIVILPWLFKRPSNDRNWSPEFAQTGSSKQKGDLITLYQFRNFDYSLDGNVTERWETKSVHLSNLRGMDLAHTTFGGGYIGHPLLSFDFGPDGRVCLTVETRREKGEQFSVIGGFYKTFELQYIFASEEDCIRLRASVRKNEPVYLYAVNMPLAEIKQFFLSALEVQNELAQKPRFYHILFSNCTTSLRDRLPKDQQGEFDLRMLVNGTLDEYLYENNKISHDGLTFDQLRKRCHINPKAKKAHSENQFSNLIRQGLPGQANR